ncbi:MAG TPA: glutaredoxin family protein [Wenzhouxiangella sp.]|nr:glutaredoxin family protein [Wenzhouxiangella sp.]HLS04983.1 glutaredoxin family protein [Wenzhouxiangella sp.]
MKLFPKDMTATYSTMLKFYTRPGCTLCDKAQALLAEGGFGQTFEMVNIESDLELLDQYGDKIPVVHNTRTGEKLSWPFTASQVRDLAAD